MESPEDLIRALYPQLRDIAGRLLRRERVDHTLQRTALVHELFLRFPDGHSGDDANPGLFLARAVRQMRQILIDHARKRNSHKRGGGRARVPVVESDLAFLRDDDAILALNQALERLGRRDPLALSVVELKHFAGFTNPETAAILGIPLGTVDSVWTHARLWLYRELNAPANDPVGSRLRRFSVNSR